MESWIRLLKRIHWRHGQTDDDSAQLIHDSLRLTPDSNVFQLPDSLLAKRCGPDVVEDARSFLQTDN